MNIRPDQIIKNMLGEDFFENLEKSDVYKMNSRTVTGLDEVSTGLKIVPRAIMSFLISSLSGMTPDDGRDIRLPFAPDCNMQVSKRDNDVFSGYIYSKGSKINEFTNRSIPGIGLVLMTTFELYDIDRIKDNKEKEAQVFDVSKLQEMIDERLRLHSLVARVVDQKLAQRDAVEILIKEKISQAIKDKAEVEEGEEEEFQEETKADKLKAFIEKSKQRQDEAQIEKSEHINCPDCGSDLYSGGKSLTLCICYGEDWNKSIKIKKNEDNIKMKFPKSMDKGNIEMLLETLKNINKE